MRNMIEKSTIPDKRGNALTNLVFSYLMHHGYLETATRFASDTGNIEELAADSENAKLRKSKITAPPPTRSQINTELTMDNNQRLHAFNFGRKNRRMLKAAGFFVSSFFKTKEGHPISSAMSEICRISTKQCSN